MPKTYIKNFSERPLSSIAVAFESKKWNCDFFKGSFRQRLDMRVIENGYVYYFKQESKNSNVYTGYIEGQGMLIAQINDNKSFWLFDEDGKKVEGSWQQLQS